MNDRRNSLCSKVFRSVHLVSLVSIIQIFENEQVGHSSRTANNMNSMNLEEAVIYFLLSYE